MKGFLIIFLSVFSLISNAQIQNALLAVKNGNLGQAKYLADSLSDLSESASNAEVFYIKGIVYEHIFLSPDSTIRKSLEQHPLKIAYSAFERAKSLSANKRYSTAAAKRIDSAITPNLLVESNLLIKQKKVDEAIPLLELFIKEKPKDTSGIILTAITAEKALNYELAKTQYQKLISLNHKTPFIYKSLISIYMENDNNFREAYNYLIQAKALFSKDPDLNKFEVNILMNSDKKKEAIRKMDSLATLEPENKKIYFYNIGVVYQGMDSVKLAKSYYERAISLDPDFYEANYNLGGIYYQKAKAIYAKINSMNYGEYQKSGKTLEYEANNFAKESLPYFEKSYSLRKEESLKAFLTDLYKNLKMKDKIKSLNQK